MNEMHKMAVKAHEGMITNLKYICARKEKEILVTKSTTFQINDIYSYRLQAASRGTIVFF
jgi:hypothetical protein